MSGMKFTQDHEWIRIEEDGSAVVGITDYAQDQLGEIVFVELPEVGDEVERGAECAVIESVKAAGELKSPASGNVVEVNEALVDAPETINSDPTGEGWIMRIEIIDPAQIEGLMDAEAYAEFVAGLD
jgi:glycine cleavage system H protein